MSFEDEGYSSAMDVVLADTFSRQGQQQAEDARLDAARRMVDEARLALAQLAQPAVLLIGLRLAGHVADSSGAPITDERVDTALTVLDRVGIPKLRATAIAASISSAPAAAAPGSPGWAPPAVEGDGEDGPELEVGSVDAQIAAFLEGARVARDIKGDAA